jgi:hypothetical protein
MYLMHYHCSGLILFHYVSLKSWAELVSQRFIIINSRTYFLKSYANPTLAKMQFHFGVKVKGSWEWITLRSLHC